MDLLISIDINYYFMFLIKGVEQDPDLGMKIVHPSIDDYSEAIDSDIMMRMTPRHHIMVKILMLLLMMR